MRSYNLLFFSFSIFVVLSTITPDIATSAWTSRFLYEENLEWRSKRNLTSSVFSQSFQNYSVQGFMIVDVDVRTEGNSARYSMVWQKNTDGRAWHEHHNLTSEQYSNYWVQYRDSGYRPLDIEVYMLNGNLRYAGIWIENVEGIAWTSTRDRTSSEYASYFSQRRSEGLRPIDIETYQTNNGLRVAAIWYDNVDNVAWSQLRNIDRTRYQQEVDDHADNGFTMIDYESYDSGNAQQYAAIWEKVPNRSANQVRTNLEEIGFANIWRISRDLGFRLVDFENYNVDGQTEPENGGIWIANEDRAWSLTLQLDNIVSSYLTTNALPGISVAVIRNGQMIYRRGFGFSDVDEGRVAHGETVYSAASVSKVFGGTLAARLEDRERLLDGATFELDLTRSTSDYLGAMPLGGDLFAAMPTHQTHTVEQLLSHLGCVAHYNTTPSLPDPSTQFSNAKTAVQTLWDIGLVTATSRVPPTACNIGTTWSYSSHAFTFVAAVLETATEKSIDTLLEDELFKPNGLSNTRVMFETETVPANYDRAKPYGSRDTIHTANVTPPDWNDPPNFSTNPNIELSGYRNSSWKVLGGGIETTAVDLARFGWRTLNGEVVDAQARENRMWTRVAGVFTGLGWNIQTLNPGNLRVAEHGGSQNGARSYLRVYRDEGVVVAIMSNRRNHRNDLNQDVNDLATDIGSMIINDLNHNGDVDGDGDRDLTDLIATLQILVGIQPNIPTYLSADINGNRRIDNAEAISIIQQLGL